MGWTQVSTTRWERPLGGMEEYLAYTGNISAALYDGRLQYNIFSKVKVELNIANAEFALRHAWKQIRYEEPDIATTLEEGKKVYEVATDTELENWLQSTFVVDYERDAEELYREGRKQKPATLYYLPRTSELVLHVHHSTADGIGVIMWWDKYFRALTNPNHDFTFGEEYTRLAPALEDVIGAKDLTPEQVEQGSVLLYEYITKLPAIGFPSKIGKAPAGQCQSLEHVFNEETTRAIIVACKKRGITVTAAVHAAYIRVLSKYADSDSNTTRYTSPCEFNIRQYLPPPYNTVAASNYYIPLPYSINLPASFWELTQHLNHYYRNQIKENPYILEVNDAFTTTLTEVVKSPEYQSAPIPTDALVSSLGLVENYLQRSYGDGVVVHDWKLACDVVLGMNGLHIYTFRDRLRMVSQFNDGYQEPETMKHYHDEIERVLREELLG
ncbi:hypothetical protein BJY04DRAFT_180922 [Aspergillus karnatakaensis]|uniref:uncharacterized protein n=1 Tax=Aspergillus karnatakaensis TaxID=1810916 RepID=UPI003CCC9E2F